MTVVRRVLAVATLVASVMGASALHALPVPAPIAADAVRLPGVEVAGMPRTYVTITIAIPEALRGESEIAFEVRLTGQTDVVGRQEGILRPSENRRVILTLRVPSDAQVGILDVADVSFRNAKGDEFIVPIFLRVPSVRGYFVNGAREFRGLRSGDRVELAYRVTNTGNAPDTLEYAVRAPFGWMARPSGSRTVVVPARAQVEIPANITVPAGANMGDHTVALWMRPLRDTVPRREAATILGVAQPSTRAGGFVLRPTVAAATSFRESAALMSAELVGPVADGVVLSVRGATDPTVRGLAMQGLAAVGALGVPFGATLTGDSWSANAGNVGTQIGELTGLSVTGFGVQYARETDDVRIRAMAAQGRQGDRLDGVLLGASYSQLMTAGRVGGGVSFLREPGGVGVGRELTAVGGEFTSRRMGTLVAGGELAYRSSAYGSGVGVAAMLSHDRKGERASLRLAHAPGGSAAFARAKNELQASYGRSLTDRWSMDAAASRTQDDGRVIQRAVNTGWSLSQRYRLTDDGTLSLRVRSARLDAERASSAFGGFGYEDRSVTAGADWQLGDYAVGAELEQGLVVRRTQLLGGSSADAASGQRTLRLNGSRDFAQVGELSAGVSYQQVGAGVGLPTQSWRATTGWASTPILLLGRPTQLNSNLSYQRFGSADAVVIARAGMRTAIPGGVDLVVNLERNPYFRDLKGRVGTVAAVSLTTSSRIFSTAMLGPDGWIFEDLNRNGRRDPDEPGVGGVVVRRGADRVVSRRDGRYRLPAAARGKTTVELASLPRGLVAHPTLAAEVAELRDIPLLPTGSLNVTMEVVADDDGRVPNVDLRQAVVVLKDDTGFEWVGRMTGPGTIAFDGIPTGTYSVRFDVAHVGEAVRLPVDLQVTVVAHEQVTLTVPVRGRVIRIMNPSSRSGSRGGRGGGPAR